MRVRPGLVLILSLAASLPAAADDDPDPRLSGDALRAFRQGEFPAAAGQWEALGQSGELAASDASLAFVLAAIARDRARDAAAYRDWGEAIRRFLEGGSRWEDARESLRHQVERIRRDVRAAAAGGAEILTGHGLAWLELDELTGLSGYAGPPPGLAAREGGPATDQEPHMPASLMPDAPGPAAPEGWERINSRQTPVDAAEPAEGPAGQQAP